MPRQPCTVCRTRSTTHDDGVCRRCRVGRWYDCKHCERKTRRTKRGICETCYKVPEIREQYRPLNRGGMFDNLTMEELDAMIAEQLKPENLPAWWWSEFEKPDAEQKRPPDVRNVKKSMSKIARNS